MLDLSAEQASERLGVQKGLQQILKSNFDAPKLLG